MLLEAAAIWAALAMVLAGPSWTCRQQPRKCTTTEKPHLHLGQAPTLDSSENWSPQGDKRYYHPAAQGVSSCHCIQGQTLASQRGTAARCEDTAMDIGCFWHRR